MNKSEKCKLRLIRYPQGRKYKRESDNIKRENGDKEDAVQLLPFAWSPHVFSSRSLLVDGNVFRFYHKSDSLRMQTYFQLSFLSAGGEKRQLEKLVLCSQATTWMAKDASEINCIKIN